MEPVRSFSRTRRCIRSLNGAGRFGGADVPAERRLADLESSLAQVKLEPPEMVPLLAPLLDMPLTKERMSYSIGRRNCADGNWPH